MHRGMDNSKRLLQGKVVTITGAAKGIGLSIAERLAAVGMHLVLLDKDVMALEKVYQALQQQGAAVLAVYADVCDVESLHAARIMALERYGRCDVLIHNAGILATESLLPPSENVEEIPSAETMNTNFWGTVLTTRLWWPMMQKSQHPHIIFISSIFAALAPMHYGLYSASKAAINAYALSLVSEIQAYHGDVSVLLAGFTRTDMYQAQNSTSAISMADVFSVAPEAVAQRVEKLLLQPRLHAYVNFVDALLVTIATNYPEALRWIAK